MKVNIKTNKNILILIALALIIVFAFLTLNKNSLTNKNNEVSQVELKLDIKEEDLSKLDQSQKKLFEDLKQAAQKEDYESFAENLAQVYKNKWEGLTPFQAIESAFYVFTTDKYFLTNNFKKSLELSSIIYDKVPMGWRFRYLKIVSHEKLGRAALERNDLDEAQRQALSILSMMYRPEGANLLGDVYIKKIKDAIAKNDKKSAKESLDFIWDYEVSSDRRAILNELKEKIK